MRRGAIEPSPTEHGRPAGPREATLKHRSPDRATLAARLVQWQREHGRHDLPWQLSRDPYRVWLSEIMLQQTQVSTVLAYYPRFLQRFPDVNALAAAPLDEVLALWSGLGYYTRARNLHRCAQVVMAEHGGHFPVGVDALSALPGIGRSTAAAIAAFSQGQRAAILDGNVQRVLARVLGFDQDLAGQAAVKALWAQAEALLPPTPDVPAYTQGLMDLGATVCLPRRADCGACCWSADCVALAEGRPLDYPIKTRRLKRQVAHGALLWLTWRGQVWLERRPDRGIWAGLWTLPVWPDAEALEAATSDWPGRGEAQAEFKHVLTHRDWWLTPWRWWWPDRDEAPTVPPSPSDATGGAKAEAVPAPGRWVTPEQALALGLPAPVRELLVSAPPRRVD